MWNRALRLTVVFVLPLLIVLSLFAYAIMPMVNNLTLHWFIKDLDIRSQLVSNTLREQLLEYIPHKDTKKITDLFARTIQDERLLALGFCDTNDMLIYKTSTFPDGLSCHSQQKDQKTASFLMTLPQGSVHINESRIMLGTELLGKLILVHDMSFIERRSEDTQKYIIILFIILAIIISLLTMLVAHFTWRVWIISLKNILLGNSPKNSYSHLALEMQPLASDLRALLREINNERGKIDDATNAWTPEKLRTLLREDLLGDEILVVANREPYIHEHTPHGIKVIRPASGLVTAIEPVLDACSGTWIAHGGGSADRETVDEFDHVAVPPEKPQFTLRRVWLSAEEEQGYYYGFANEGLWPLCHIAHVRPTFRSSDWEHYVTINQRFTDAVIKETRTDNPVILVQDYHFALLPRMVREVLPKATIIMFWHIPWPNPESFGICPWRDDILEGLLGSTILGFHTPFHCKNFLETVDRFMETKIEHESSTISYGGQLTQVVSYPISIAWPTNNSNVPTVKQCHDAIRRELSLSEDHLLGVGVDRLDYTKGIIERFQAVEILLEMHPELIRHFTFVQIAAPSRSSLDDYKNFDVQIRALTKRINDKFSVGDYSPILLKIEHHSIDEINRYYRAANVCMVTSLHDGMNLVAKEFIAARDDELGVLVLSQFTGAARELHEALIINPYHVENCAKILYQALTMPEVEQHERMLSMRSFVKEFNIFRWAGRMLLDAARLRERKRVMLKIRAHSKKRFSTDT